jgi:hypothetical protein
VSILQKGTLAKMDSKTKFRVWIAEGREGELEPFFLFLVPPATPDEMKLYQEIADYGHEGEEGVFYLLADDAFAKVTLSADSATITFDAHTVVLTYQNIPLDWAGLARANGCILFLDHNYADIVGLTNEPTFEELSEHGVLVMNVMDEFIEEG